MTLIKCGRCEHTQHVKASLVKFCLCWSCIFQILEREHEVDREK